MPEPSGAKLLRMVPYQSRPFASTAPSLLRFSGSFSGVATPENDPVNRSNDGAVDAKGRLWYGTMRNNFAPDGSGIPVTEAKGALYRIEPDLSASVMESNVGREVVAH